MATVRQRGNSYQIIVSCGYDSAGKQIKHTLTWKPAPGMTKKQIEKELERQKILFDEKCHGLEIGGSIRFSDFCDQWFTEYAETQLKENTVNRYQTLRRRTLTALGHMHMNKITTRHIQAFINNLSEKGINEKTSAPLAVKTIAHYLSFVSSIFEYAIRQGMLTDNPCKRAFLPKEERKEKEIYTLEQVQRLLLLLQDAKPKYYAFFTLAIFGGFRRGEILGLEWKDIDFENEVVHIRRTSNYTGRRGAFTDTPKTKSSVRSLKMPGFVFEVLAAHRKDQNRMRLALGDCWHFTDRLFTKEDGMPMNGCTPYEWMKDFCTRNDLPFYGIHVFRHLNATMLIHSGANIRTVSSALGHSQVSTTMNIYSHSIAEEQAKASEALATTLLPDAARAHA